jgi:flagellar FliJ protein
MMAKFNFRLQSWFKIKEKLERQKEIEYGLAVAALNREMQILDEMKADRDFCIAEFKNGIKKRIDPASFQRYNHYIDLMKKKIKMQEIEVWKAREFANKKHRELLKAMQERKAIEKLRERALEEHKELEKRDEQRINDGVVTYMYAKER